MSIDALVTTDDGIKKLVQMTVSKWRTSKAISRMKTATAYYSVENEEINKKNRSYGTDHGTVESNLSNMKIASSFVRTSVNQKVNYAFGKPFTFRVENLEIDKSEFSDDKKAEQYLQMWTKFITPEYRRSLQSLAYGATNHGIGWAYLCIDSDDGMLKMTTVPSETVYPIWKDAAHTKLRAVIRDYSDSDYSGDEIRNVNIVEYWDSYKVVSFVDYGSGLEFNSSNPHMMTTDSVGYGFYGEEKREDVPLGWGRVPFVFLKGSRDELPLLYTAKDQIDAYDSLNSKTSDGLMDDIDPLLVLNGCSAQMDGTHGLSNMRKVMKEFRIVAMGDDSKAEYLQVNIDISGVLNKLDFHKKEIRDSTQTVDIQDINLGGDVSSPVFKAKFQNIDIYTNAIEIEHEVLVDNQKYFMDLWCAYIGVGTVEQWKKYFLRVRLDRDMMLNESQIILDSSISYGTGVISQRTIYENHPWIISPEVEFERLTAEQKERESNEDPYSGGFPLVDKEKELVDDSNKQGK